MSPLSNHGSNSDLAIRQFELTYDSQNCEASATQLIYALYPEWRQAQGKLKFVRFTEGITNTLLKAEKRRPGHNQTQIDQDAILLRAYGEGTDVLIDREREIKAHSLLATRNLAPPLLARFKNGLLYKFVSGDVCTPDDIRNPPIYRAVAQTLGQWHGALPISYISDAQDFEAPSTNGVHKSKTQRPVPNLWTIIQSWIDVLPSKSKKEQRRKHELQTEYHELSTRLWDTPGPAGKGFVFSHCDLLCGNVIVKQTAGSNGHLKDGPSHEVGFIDYEYATPAPAAFDIANHFAEWGGIDCDPNAMPSRSQRREFLTYYTQAFQAHTDSRTSMDETVGIIDQLFDQVDLYRGVPGFYWGIWAIIQSQISQIDFDYVAYAELRFSEYYAWKAESDGSRKQDGREMPIRERKWAEE